MRIGYARTSSLEQIYGLEAQIRDLQAQGCKKIFQEQISSVNSRREKLEEALDYIREEDILVVTRLDRLARSVAHLIKIEEILREKGASLLILDPAMDTATPTGRLVFNLIASIAQFERDIMLLRQREGIEKAKLDGKYRGRKPTARMKSEQIMQMLNNGNKKTYIAKQLNISTKSVDRVVQAQKKLLQI